jgi:hypothetical protein
MIPQKYQKCCDVESQHKYRHDDHFRVGIGAPPPPPEVCSGGKALAVTRCTGMAASWRFAAVRQRNEADLSRVVSGEHGSSGRPIWRRVVKWRFEIRVLSLPPAPAAGRLKNCGLPRRLLGLRCHWRTGRPASVKRD